MILRTVRRRYGLPLTLEGFAALCALCIFLGSIIAVVAP